MKEWYYSEFGQTKGPVSLSQIVDKVLKQDLELESYVTQGIDQPWKRIKEFPELMEELHKPETLNHVQFPANFAEEGSEVRVGNLYFYIPIKRFIVMSILSGGFYQFYWFYKQWYYWDFKHRKTYQVPNRYYDWIFFPWTIFQKIETDPDLNAVKRSDFSGVLIFWMWVLFGAAVYIILTAFRRLFGYPDVVWILIGSMDVLILLPIQRYINLVNAKLGNTYDKPGLGHYLSIIIGIVTIISFVNISKLLSLLKL